MIRDIYLVHHSHTDIGYTNHPETVMANQRAYLRRAMRLAEKHAGNLQPFKWTVEALLTLEDFLRTASPAEIERLQALHRAGLIDFGGLWGNWSPLADVQILAETIGVAARLRREYGFAIEYALNCDVTGLPWGIVELLLDGGFRGLAMAMNRTMARDPQPRPRGFWWAGPSGRKLLTWHGDHYGIGQHFGVPRVKTSAGWVMDLEASIPKLRGYLAGLEARRYPHDFALLQITSTFMYDNGGPHEDLVHFVTDWNARDEALPQLRMATLKDFFDRLAQETALQAQSGDWTDWWTQGFAASSFETALGRQAHVRWFAARELGALLSGLRPPFTPDPADEEHALRSLALFDEHTWGMDESVTHPSSPNTRGALTYKYHLAYAANAAITRLAQAGLRDLAARLPQSTEPRVLVFNPLPWPRRAPLYLPRVSSTSWALPNLERNLELAAPHAGVNLGVDYGQVDLPAGGYVTVPLRTAGPVSPQPGFSLEGMAEVKAPDFIPAIAPGLAATTGVTSDGWTLANRFYALRLDPASGAIVSLVSQTDGREWVDHSTPWRLGHYVYETNRSPRGRRDMQITMAAGADFDRQPFLAPRRRGADSVLDCRFVPGVGKGRLALRLQAPGAHDLRFQVILYEDEPWIDLIYDLDKLAVTEPESVYVVFPLALAQPAAFYDTAGAVVQAEAEQLPYACRDFYFIQRWAALNDGNRGATLISPEAALVHFGGFTNHQYRPRLEMGQPNLVSWLMNNHWMTAYPASQQGWTRFTYRLILHTGPFDRAAAARAAAEFCAPPLCGPLIDHPAGLMERAFGFAPHLPPSASLLRLEPASVLLAAARPIPGGLELVLQETGGRSTAFLLEFGLSLPLRAHWLGSDGQESDGSELTVQQNRVQGMLEARRTRFLRVEFSQPTSSLGLGAKGSS
jgi:hypothetical protein